MAGLGINLTGQEGYFAFAFDFGRIHCLPNPATGMLPNPLQCVGWGASLRRRPEGPTMRALRMIDEMERRQGTGDLEYVSANMEALQEVAARLETEADKLHGLVDRARAICARHEPSAGRRREL